MRLSDVQNSPHFKEQANLIEKSLLPQYLGLAANFEFNVIELSEKINDLTIPLQERLAIGTILSVTHDPRIEIFNPLTCFIPGGEVKIGTKKENVKMIVEKWSHVGVIFPWIEKETPEHQVTLRDFWMAKYPVTNMEYREFLEDTEYTARPTSWYLGAFPWDKANHPVAGIEACDADQYANWLSTKTKHPWRLPTEVEWERAARSDEEREYPWGNVFDSNACNTRETGIHTTTPVGIFPSGQSKYGVYDMAGNVEEFVADDYKPYPNGPFIEDHLVETLGKYRVTRGGCFSRYGDLARTRRRHGAFPSPLYPVGFRLVTSMLPE